MSVDGTAAPDPASGPDPAAAPDPVAAPDLMAVVGWMAFAVPNLRSQALPRWNWLPLIIGLIPVAGTVFIGLSNWLLAIGAVLFGVAWVLLGYAIRSADSTTART